MFDIICTRTAEARKPYPEVMRVKLELSEAFRQIGVFRFTFPKYDFRLQCSPECLHILTRQPGP